jgi:hypothetical protein
MESSLGKDFEVIHAEWLRVGGDAFYQQHYGGPGAEYYKSDYWKLLRECILQRDSLRCVRCGKPAVQVHHVHYDFVGADHLHPETLASVCRPCHGLVEYARKADSLSRRINRRTVAVQRFLSGASSIDGPVKSYARLLKYRDELLNLRRLFEGKISYSNPTPPQPVLDQLRLRRQTNEKALFDAAAIEVSEWGGSDNHKAEQIIRLLQSEIENCRRFQAYVFAPVPRPSAAQEAKQGRRNYKVGQMGRIGQIGPIGNGQWGDRRKSEFRRKS